MSKIVDIVTELAKPVVEQAGCILWDVEYVKEAGQWHLRVYIDKDEGISIEDCENVSHTLNPILDEKDPIADSYVFEVSSAGLERTLKYPEHFTRFIGKTVEIKLYKAQNGSKVFSGTLIKYENGDVTIETENGKTTFLKKQVAVVRISLF